MQDAITRRRTYRHLLIELLLIALAWLGLAVAAAALAVRLDRGPAIAIGLLAMLCAGLLVRLWGSVLARAAWLQAAGAADEGHQ